LHPKPKTQKGLGSSLLVAIDRDPTLEPLFRYTNKEVQGTKFVDMLSSIVANINSPETIFKKIAELAGAQVLGFS